MPDLEVEAARSGGSTLKWKGRHLVSAFDPAREAERLVAASVAPGTSVVVLLGLGLGHHAEAAARRGARVVAVERRPEIVEAARRSGPFGALERSGTVAVVVGLEGAALREAIRAGLDVWTMRRVVTLPGPAPPEDAAYYAAAKALARQAVEDAAEEIRTVQGFARPWLANALAHLRRAAEGPTLAAWAGAWRGRPAVVLAAGPSAAEGIVALAAAGPRRPPVACVDAALPMALARGLVPEFVVAADPQERVARHLGATGAPPDVPLAALLTSNAAATALFRRVLFVGASYPLEAALGWGAADRLETTGGSVATVAAAILERMGASPILLVGADLSLPGGVLYAAGGLVDMEAATAAGRFATVETRRRRPREASNARPVPAADGGTVLSPPNFESYRRWFEAAAARGLSIVQTSRRGARIEGARHEPLEGYLRESRPPAPPPWPPPRRAAPAARRLAAWALEAEEVGAALETGAPPARFHGRPVYALIEHLVVADAFQAARAEPDRAGEILRRAAGAAGREIAAALRRSVTPPA